MFQHRRSLVMSYVFHALFSWESLFIASFDERGPVETF